MFSESASVLLTELSLSPIAGYTQYVGSCFALTVRLMLLRAFRELNPTILVLFRSFKALPIKSVKKVSLPNKRMFDIVYKVPDFGSNANTKIFRAEKFAIVETISNPLWNVWV